MIQDIHRTIGYRIHLPVPGIRVILTVDIRYQARGTKFRYWYHTFRVDLVVDFDFEAVVFHISIIFLFSRLKCAGQLVK